MINNSEFLLKEFPKYNPVTEKADRISFWREVKRRCMEGYWVGNKWMPGELYTYGNIWHIQLNDKSRKNSGKVTSRPWIRDLEWEKSYLATEAFGFSGFDGDTQTTCDVRYDPAQRDYWIRMGNITLEESKSKTYIPVREYLRRNHPKALGKPLYNNPAKNIIDIEARGGGKSYLASCFMFHNFYFDGSHDYDEYLRRRQEGVPMTSETLVGAIDAKFSSDLISKYQNGIKLLPGAANFMGIDYPSPFAVNTTGSYDAGSKGAINTLSGSKFHHRTFNEKATAGNGTRPSKAFLEEIGFFFRLIETLGAMKDTTYDGTFKFGTIWMFGTSGDMEGGSSLAAQKVFYNPEEFECLTFDDRWDGRGKIGLFIPAHLAINDFKKGPNLITDMDLANEVLTAERERLKKGKSQKLYNADLQNRPHKPSEAFLTIGSNKFPIKMLDENLDRILKNDRVLASYWTGFVRPLSGTKELQWVNTSDKAFREYPPEMEGDQFGCVEIYEHPKPIMKGFGVRYIAAVDPVDDDGVEGSLQSCFIFDILTERIVAEYTGRTEIVDEWYENCRLLLMYYNALCLYENNKKGFYNHMRLKHSLHLLATTPEVLLAMDVTTSTPEANNKRYGVVATTPVNNFGRDMYNKWLRDQAIGRDEGVTNAMHMPSLGLTYETKNYSTEGNFDRISAIEKLFILYAEILYQLGGIDAVNEKRQPKEEPVVETKEGNSFFNDPYEKWVQKRNKMTQTHGSRN